MNIIFIKRSHGQSRTLTLGNKHIITLGAIITGTIVALIFSGYWVKRNLMLDGDAVMMDVQVINAWERELAQQKKMLDQISKSNGEQVDALTLRLGDMQARLLRIDALGVRLKEVAKIKNDEFDFSQPPALGGPLLAAESMPSSLPSLKGDLDRIAKHIENRQQQLDRLESMFFQRGLDQESFVSGRPVRWGWLSSSYGYRNDPFNGRRTWHAGVDFAGKEGSDIIAVASGVVTWSSERYGYGNLVEINHGDGYSTRYAHCKELLVKVGEVVEKGQVLALMGSTGRSTGPHVHFEVLRKGMTLDPKKFLHRASR
jgi:murein DD-endopeptidase MepM/ murein hydrolase activator NlpD